jgi:hypothetical protein
MAGRTPNFGLSTFGGDTPGSIADDGGKYTLTDRLLIDKILQALAQNDGHVHAASADVPTDAPDPSLLTDAGTLPAGEEFFYEVTFVTLDGLETVPGDEVSQSTPDILPEPATPSAVTGTTGGNHLPAGIWYYAITGIRGAEESILSPAFSTTVLSGENTATLTLPALGDADSYRVWRMGLNESGYTKLGTSATGTFVDDGSIPSNPCPTDPSNQPPQVNAGINRYAVQLDLSTADAALITAGGFRSWRIYRTDVSGQYTSVSLVHEVVETVDELDPDSGLVTTWIDDGDDLLTGTPPTTSEVLNLVPFSFEVFATDPATTGYPEGYPILVGSGGAKVMKVLIDGTWTAVGSGGGGGPTPVQAWESSWTPAVPLIDTTTHAFLVPLANVQRFSPGQSDLMWVSVPNNAVIVGEKGSVACHVDAYVDVSGCTAGDILTLGKDTSTLDHGQVRLALTAADVTAGHVTLSLDFTEFVYNEFFAFAPWLTGPATALVQAVTWETMLVSDDGTTVGVTVPDNLVQVLKAVAYSDDGTDATVTWDASGTPPGGLVGTELVDFEWADLNGNGPVDAIDVTAAWNAGTVTVPLPSTSGAAVLQVFGPGPDTWLAQTAGVVAVP